MSPFFFKRRKSPESLNEQLFNQVKELLCKHLGVADKTKVTPDTKLADDLGVDSLDTVELILELEEVFGIEIPDEVTEKIETVRDIVEYIETHIEKGETS